MNQPVRQPSRSPMRLSMFACLVLLGLSVAANRPTAGAQTERHGIRVRYTSITSAGGLEGRAFLPVSSAGVSEAAHPDAKCAGIRNLSVRASVARGPLCTLFLRFNPTKVGRAPLASDDCQGAEIEVTLEDQSVLRGGRGYVELERGPSAEDPTYRGSFSETVSYRGAPITIEGSFVVPAPN